MPTHRDLLSAEVAFILYDGQVYMSHPTDSDVSLTKLVRDIGNLGHLDNPLVEQIQGFLRGTDKAPPELQLVGRYNMTNGRIAPYGPVNSQENQEAVRSAIQQAAYNAPVSSPDQSSAPPSMESTGSIKVEPEWRIARQFMPLVNKIGQDECPGCGQKRSLYHMKDGYTAQAMGIYGHGLCRDCLTTRMDQHEAMTGQKLGQEMVRIGNFNMVAKDVLQLFDKMQNRVWEQQIMPVRTKMRAEGPVQRDKADRMGVWWLKTIKLLKETAPETYKLLPWLARTMVKDQITNNTPEHVRDILQQTQRHLDRMRDDPRPEVQVPDIMRDFKGTMNDDGTYGLRPFRQLEQWVYDLNSQNINEEANAKNKTVFSWPDGWTIQELHENALGYEGDQMGHCVGGYGYCERVERGDTHIYSLRDPKNRPHVTFEIEGQKMYEPVNKDRTPEEENERIKQQAERRQDISIHQPMFSENHYQEIQRPPLTAPPYQTQWGEALTNPNHEGIDDETEHFAPWKIIQIQGKEDSAPKPEYQERIREFFDYIKASGAQLEWHNEAQGHMHEEEYISDVSDVMSYYNDYINGNYGYHDYPSEEMKLRARQPYDPYGMPWKPLIDSGGLYVSPDGLEGIVLQAVQQYVSDAPYGRGNSWQYNTLDVDPDELAKALIFLVDELEIKERGKTGKSMIWHDRLSEAYEKAQRWLDAQLNEVRENNQDYEWEMQNGAWEEIKQDNEDPDSETGYAEGFNPDEMDYEHPDMQQAQQYIEQEMFSHYSQSLEFLRKLYEAMSGQSKPQEIPVGLNPEEPEQGSLPGALTHWTLAK